jgi:hypothetical protein
MSTIKILQDRGSDSERLSRVLLDGEEFITESGLFTGDGITIGGKPAFKVTTEDGTITQTIEDINLQPNETKVLEHILGATPKQITVTESTTKDSIRLGIDNLVLDGCENVNDKIRPIVTKVSDKHPTLNFANSATVDMKMKTLTATTYANSQKLQLVDNSKNFIDLQTYPSESIGNFYPYFTINEHKNRIYMYIDKVSTYYRNVTESGYYDIVEFDILTLNATNRFTSKDIFTLFNGSNTFYNGGGYNSSYMDSQVTIFLDYNEDTKIGLIGRSVYGDNIELIKYDFNTNENLGEITNPIIRSMQHIINISENNGVFYVMLQDYKQTNIYTFDIETNEMVLLTTLSRYSASYFFSGRTFFYDDGGMLFSNGTNGVYIKNGIETSLSYVNLAPHGLNYFKIVEFNSNKYCIAWADCAYTFRIDKIVGDGSIINIQPQTILNSSYINSSKCYVYEESSNLIIELFGFKTGTGYANKVTLTTSEVVSMETATTIFTADTGTGTETVPFYILDEYTKTTSTSLVTAKRLDLINTTQWKSINSIKVECDSVGETAEIQFYGNDTSTVLPSPYNVPLTLDSTLYNNIKGSDLIKTFAITGTTGSTYMLALDGDTFMVNTVTFDTDLNKTALLIANEINANSLTSVLGQEVRASVSATNTLRVVFKSFQGIEFFNSIAITNTGTGGGTNTNIQDGLISLLDTVKAQTGESSFCYEVSLQTTDADKTPVFSGMTWNVSSDEFREMLDTTVIKVAVGASNIRLTNRTGSSKKVNVSLSK